MAEQSTNNIVDNLNIRKPNTSDLASLECLDLVTRTISENLSLILVHTNLKYLNNAFEGMSMSASERWIQYWHTHTRYERQNYV
jgi:hypothetical protein